MKGRKRHIVVDSMGLLLAVYISGADIHDSVGACELLRGMDEREFSRLEEFVADSAYRGERVETEAFVAGQWDVRIVTSHDAHVPLAVYIRVPIPTVRHPSRRE